MWFNPNWDSATHSGYDTLWFYRHNADNVYTLGYDGISRILFAAVIDGNAYYIRTEDLDDYMVKGNWYNIQAAWDLENDFATVVIDGKINQVENITEEFQGAPAFNLIGYNLVCYADGTIDEFKIYSEPILPFGAYYTGFEQNNSYAYVDPSLLFYWDAESETANYPGSKTVSQNSTPTLSNTRSITGSKSVEVPSACDNYSFSIENGDIFDKNKGSVGFWYYPTGIGQNGLFRAYIDASNYLSITHATPSTDAIWARWEADSNTVYANGTAGDLTLNAWNWVKVTWDTYSDELKIFINGMQSGSTATIGTDMIGEIAEIAVGDAGCDWESKSYLDQIFITNNPASQEIPTAFGKPLNIPLMKVNNTRQRYGYDYRVSFTPDPSSVILQYFKDVTDLSVFEVGGGEGAAQVKTLRGGVRLQGGVRF